MITLGNKDVLEIISVTDSDGNKWYQVESLAQDLVYDEVRNDAEFDPNLAAYNDTTPYMIKLIRTKKRYKSYIKSDGSYQLRFGSGVSTENDEEVIPNPSTVVISQPSQFKTGARHYQKKYLIDKIL